MLFDKWFKKNSMSFHLDGDSIDRASEWLAREMTEMGMARSDRLRTRLLLEEALVDLSKHFGVEQEADVLVEKRFGRARLHLRTKGEQFNLLGSENDPERDEYSYSLFSALGLRIQYSYELGVNVLRISLPRSSTNLVLKIGIAIVVGAMIGVIGNALIPDALQEAISDTVLTPLANMWVRLLQAISGPVIFLTALMGTLSMKRVTEFGGSRLSTIARYFAVGALVIAFTMACSLPIFSPDIDITHANRQVLGNTLDQILQIVPENLIAPFLSANTLQLLLIAIVTGVILGALGTQVSGLSAIIRQLNILGLTVAQHAGMFVPVFVGLLLCLKIWTHDIELLGGIWVPLVLAAAISAAVLLITILITSAHMRVSPLLLARKLKGPFINTLKRGTLNFASVDDLADSCKRLLGVNGEFAKATLPQGLFLYMPTSGVGIFVFVLFAAQTQQIEIDQMWLLSAAVLSVVLAVATPPLTGANLLSFIVAFTYLGIQDGAMLDVMVFDIVFGVLCMALDQAMLQLETIRQAKHMGFLDESVLHAPLD